MLYCLLSSFNQKQSYYPEYLYNIFIRDVQGFIDTALVNIEPWITMS